MGEHVVDVRGKRIACKTWQDPGRPPLLALHGWLDNAGSFDRLAPRLGGFHVTAPDFAGHGLSDHRSLDSAYNLWQDAGDMLDLVAALELATPLTVVGHSRGAMIAVMMAAMYPDLVHRLVLLDGLMPLPVKAEEAVTQLRSAYEDRQRYLAKPVRHYASQELAVRSRMQGPLGLSRGAVDALAARGLARDDRGYFWRADPRLRGASEMKLTHAHSLAYVRAIRCPALLLVGLHPPEIYEPLVAENPRVEVRRIAENHHFHLEEASCGAVVAIIGDFLGS